MTTQDFIALFQEAFGKKVQLPRNIMGSVLVIIYYTLGQICVNSPD